jgi:zinc protease
VKPGQWPQAVSDVAPDPRVRFGVLPNGLRYAIQKNATPPGQAALRLWFDAGSLDETDEQQGLAHFLEHMAFNGSKNVPEGDMIKILERHGLSFGADTNASTNFSETTYQLDLPKTDDDTVDTSLMLLREAAGELTIAPDAVDRERGVVLSEERTRDSPGYRVFVNTFGFQLEGQRPPQRLSDRQDRDPQDRPGPAHPRLLPGLVPARERRGRGRRRLRRRRHGSQDQGPVRRLEGQGPPGVKPDLGPVAKRGLTAKVLVEPGAQTSVQMAWIAPPDLELETRAKDKEELIKALGFAVLNRRLQVLTRSDAPPFIVAVAVQNDQEHAADITTLAATPSRATGTRP